MCKHSVLVVVYLFTFFAGIELLAQGVQATSQIVASVFYAGCACCIGAGTIGTVYHATMVFILPIVEILQAGKRCQLQCSDSCESEDSESESENVGKYARLTC